MEETPVGYRFHPNDQEIINHYLKLKMDGRHILVDAIIREIDPCGHEPWDLPDLARVWPGDQVWYFYCRLDYKDANNRKRANRTTRAGNWKATGKVRFIKDKGRQIGTKRTLVFHQKLPGSGSKPIKTDWVIHEYQAQTILSHQVEYVLWKLKDKADYAASDLENPTVAEQATIPESNMCIPEESLEDFLGPTDFSDYPTDGSPTYDEGEPSFLMSSDHENPTMTEQAYTSDPMDFLQSNMRDPQGIFIEDFLSSLPDQNPAFGSSNDELADEQLADSFLNLPDEYIGFARSSHKHSHKHEHRAVCRTLVAEEEVSSGYTEFQVQGDIIGATSKGFASNKQRCLVPKKGREALQVSNAKPALKLKLNQSASTDEKGRLIHLETAASSYGSSPPSVYILNVLVGLVLFIIIGREMWIFY